MKLIYAFFVGCWFTANVFYLCNHTWIDWHYGFISKEPVIYDGDFWRSTVKTSDGCAWMYDKGEWFQLAQVLNSSTPTPTR